VRWQSPERGLVPPVAFVPLAERTGLIEEIGRWVIAACCAQLGAWRADGHELSMSFNVSPRQFRDASLVAALRAALAEHALDPRQVVVEITETTAMRDAACVAPVLAELRALGVRLAIDDFGAGHSSLARLRDLAADQLKIDRAFLTAVPGDPRAAELIGAALGLGGALGMSAVAEGVETEQQRAFLVDRGCPLAQGFHLARPAPAEKVTALLEARRSHAAPCRA